MDTTISFTPLNDFVHFFFIESMWRHHLWLKLIDTNLIDDHYLNHVFNTIIERDHLLKQRIYTYINHFLTIINSNNPTDNCVYIEDYQDFLKISDISDISNIYQIDTTWKTSLSSYIYRRFSNRRIADKLLKSILKLETSWKKSIYEYIDLLNISVTDFFDDDDLINITLS